MSFDTNIAHEYRVVEPEVIMDCIFHFLALIVQFVPLPDDIAENRLPPPVVFFLEVWTTNFRVVEIRRDPGEETFVVPGRDGRERVVKGRVRKRINQLTSNERGSSYVKTSGTFTE